jgi:hypothetical protein
MEVLLMKSLPKSRIYRELQNNGNPPYPSPPHQQFHPSLRLIGQNKAAAARIISRQAPLCNLSVGGG